jgi:LysM repeat protein
MIRINPIFFDYNKSEIRTDAALELDRIVSIMNRFPRLIIESTSHTDARGKSRYNGSLSDRRAKSTERYIISKGIAENRITGKGYGESKLTNGCVDNDAHTNRTKCSKEEHQANRRSEFLITNISDLGIAVKLVKEVEIIEKKKEVKVDKNVHVVKSGETLYSIATRYGISVNTLKKLNNLTDNNITIGQTLKLK